MHESWNKPAGFLRHVGRGACAVCESGRPHVGFHPAVSGCHSEACGGTAMRPHATLQPRLTSNTSHTSAPSPSRFHLPSRTQLLAQPTRISIHWRRRRGEKATAEAEESTVFTAVGGARRKEAAAPERLQVEGNAHYNSCNPFLHFSPFPPCSIPRSRFVEIQAIRRCVGIPAGGEVAC